MLFRELAERMARIEATRSRLEMARLLSETLKAASPEETAPIAHMLLGALAPDHAGIEVGLAEKMVVRLLKTRTGTSQERVRQLAVETGDYGIVAEKLWGGPRAGQVGLEAFGKAPPARPATVLAVHGALCDVAAVTGEGSQEDKLSRAYRVLDQASPLEARYLVRFLMGKLRLGVADMTLIDGAALAYAPADEITVEKDGLPRPPASWRGALERAYNLTSDIGATLATARREGLAGLKIVHIAPGSPVRPMLAERLTEPTEVFEKVGKPALAEFKYDGLRMQAHVARGKVQLFSRRMEDVTAQFPDVQGALAAAFAGHEVVAEGEAVPVEAETGRIRPFQDIATRRGRKHGLEAAMEEVPIHLYLFDILAADGQDLTVLPLGERRARLTKLLRAHGTVHMSHAREIGNDGDLEVFFEEAVAEGMEGVMVKSLQPDSSYQAGARAWRWVKYKRDYVEALADSFDLVIVGAFHGRGRRAGWYGALLGAAYNPEEERFETVCKIGTGFTDQLLASLTAVLDLHKVDACPRNVACELQPDAYFEPVVVAEVRGAEITRSPVHTAAKGPEGGLALRFPRFLRWRDDKGPGDATTVAEVADLFERQRKRTT